MSETPMTDAWLASQQMMETFSGFSPDEIERMSMAQYAKLRQRAGLPPVEHPAAPVPAPPAPPEPVSTETVTAPEPVDFSQLSMGEYAELRAQLGIGAGRQEGVGIFDSAGRQAQLNGVRAHAGRTGMSNANVIEPPRLTGRQVRQGDGLDRRSARDRFTFPGSAFQG